MECDERSMHYIYQRSGECSAQRSSYGKQEIPIAVKKITQNTTRDIIKGAYSDITSSGERKPCQSTFLRLSPDGGPMRQRRQHIWNIHMYVWCDTLIASEWHFNKPIISSVLHTAVGPKTSSSSWVVSKSRSREGHWDPSCMKKMQKQGLIWSRSMHCNKPLESDK